jgi:hypothetical protein
MFDACAYNVDCLKKNVLLRQKGGGWTTLEWRWRRATGNCLQNVKFEMGVGKMWTIWIHCL